MARRRNRWTEPQKKYCYICSTYKPQDEIYFTFPEGSVCKACKETGKYESRADFDARLDEVNNLVELERLYKELSAECEGATVNAEMMARDLSDGGRFRRQSRSEYLFEYKKRRCWERMNKIKAQQQEQKPVSVPQDDPF